MSTKGWKTIIFNGVMLVVGVTGAEVSPELVTEFTEEFIAVVTIGNGILRAVTTTPIFNRKAGRGIGSLAVLGLAVLLVGCGGPVTSTLAKGVDEACAQFNANPLLAMPGRMQAVGAINALTTGGNYTAADCDGDGKPDFDIDPSNGQPLPVTP